MQNAGKEQKDSIYLILESLHTNYRKKSGKPLHDPLTQAEVKALKEIYQLLLLDEKNRDAFLDQNKVPESEA